MPRIFAFGIPYVLQDVISRFPNGVKNIIKNLYGHRSLSCPWPCLHYRGLYCTWTIDMSTPAGAWAALGLTWATGAAPRRVYTTWVWAAPRRGCTTGAFAVPGRANTTEACAAPGLVSKTEACTWTCPDNRSLHVLVWLVFTRVVDPDPEPDPDPYWIRIQ
jgi:hypothetical protein